MKKYCILLAFLCLLFSCTQNDESLDIFDHDTGSVIPDETLSIISRLGYDPTEIFIFNDGFMVEGDTYLSNEFIEKIKTELDSTNLTRHKYWGDDRKLDVPHNKKTRIIIGVDPNIRNSWISSWNDNRSPESLFQEISLAFSKVPDFALEIDYKFTTSGNIRILRISDPGKWHPEYPFGFNGIGYAEIPNMGVQNNIYLDHTHSAWTTDEYHVKFRNMTHLIMHALGVGHVSSSSYPGDNNLSNDFFVNGLTEIDIPGTAQTDEFSVMAKNVIDQTWYGTFTSDDIKALQYLYPYVPDEENGGGGQGGGNETPDPPAKKEFKISLQTGGIFHTTSGETKTWYRNITAKADKAVAEEIKVAVEVKTASGSEAVGELTIKKGTTTSEAKTVKVYEVRSASQVLYQANSISVGKLTTDDKNNNYIKGTDLTNVLPPIHKIRMSYTYYQDSPNWGYIICSSDDSLTDAEIPSSVTIPIEYTEIDVISGTEQLHSFNLPLFSCNDFPVQTLTDSEYRVRKNVHFLSPVVSSSESRAFIMNYDSKPAFDSYTVTNYILLERKSQVLPNREGSANALSIRSQYPVDTDVTVSFDYIMTHGKTGEVEHTVQTITLPKGRKESDTFYFYDQDLRSGFGPYTATFSNFRSPEGRSQFQNYTSGYLVNPTWDPPFTSNFIRMSVTPVTAGTDKLFLVNVSSSKPVSETIRVGCTYQVEDLATGVVTEEKTTFTINRGTSTSQAYLPFITTKSVTSGYRFEDPETEGMTFDCFVRTYSLEPELSWQ